MPRCPRGHPSGTEDFCDECGAPMEAASPAAEPLHVAAVEPCPQCGSPRAGRFCEEDGYDFELGPVAPPVAPGTPVATAPPGSPAWSLVVEADREYYERVLARRGPDIDTVTFPIYYPRTEVRLDGEEMRIGRRRAGAAGPAPHIDLTGPPLDPGVSHLHAVLLADGTGGWSLLDPGSTNGTTLNGREDRVPVDALVALSPGDRVHVGAYTTLTLRRAPPDPTSVDHRPSVW